MILLVCGGRDFTDSDYIHHILESFERQKGIDILVQGGCKGVDLIAGAWARKRGIHTAQVDALWDYYREQGNVKVAGFKRNFAMSLLNIDYCIAIGGKQGTRGMINLMKEKGVKVKEFKCEE